jgi:two-component system sensor histidine kinase KdpD
VIGDGVPWRRIRDAVLLHGRAGLVGTFVALALVAVLTGGLLLLSYALPPELMPIIYIIPVVIAATRAGLWSAAVAALAGTAAADFFFIPPYYSLRIDDPQNAIELLVFLGVALICSNLAARVRAEADASLRRERLIGSLYEFSRQLARCFTVNDLLDATQRFVSRALDRPAMLFIAAGDDGAELEDTSALPDQVRQEITALIRQGDLRIRTVTDRAANREWLLKPLVWKGMHRGAVAVDLGSGPHASIDDDLQHIESAIEEAALTLARLDIGNAMNEARARLQDDLLKDALHGIVSHELRTPLAAILGAASVLDAALVGPENARAHSLVDGIQEEARQLDGFLDTLITASRVNAAGVKPRAEWVEPADIINDALARRSKRLARHVVETRFGAELPLIQVDPVMIVEACGQLLDNAVKYSAAGSHIAIEVRLAGERVAIAVTDQGSGLAPDEMSELGRKSYRGRRHRQVTPGFGLGLWIVAAFVRANGGAFKIANRTDRPGTVATIFLPADQDSPHENDMALTHD